MASVLRRQGILWPASDASDDSDSDEPIDYGDSAGVPSDGTDTLLEHLRDSLITGLHANSPDPGTTGSYTQATGEPSSGSTNIITPAIQPNELGRNEPEFPDIAQVELVVEPV